MGVDRKIYIGAYIDCRTTNVSTIQKITGCPNKSCSRFSKETSIKFCNDCGSKITECSISKNKPKICTWEVGEKLKDVLFPANHWGAPDEVDGVIAHYWLSNRKTKAGLWINQSDPSFVTEMESVSEIEAHKQEMLTYHQSEYKILQEIYGAENVTVRWGIINMVW